MASRGKVAEASIKQLVERIDLAQHLAPAVALKRSGDHYAAKCPFHADSSPSFHVYRDHYHCFGCAAHGNVIDFEMQRNGLGFRDAVESLADRYGVALEVLGDGATSGQSDAELAGRKRKQQIMAKVADFYRGMLTRSTEGETARAYLKGRGYNSATAAFWGLGYSPKQGALSGLAKENGWNPEELLDLGLARPRRSGTGFADFFWGRLMIPIEDERGQVIAFGARILPSSTEAPATERESPKYLNSPETPIFSKSRTLFNLHRARKAIVREKAVVVVEGYMDCMALVNAGIENVVAILGTALTPEHVRKLGKLASRIVLCLDSDAAGRSALVKSFTAAYPLGLCELLTIAVPEGKDPDDFIRIAGVDAFRTLLLQPRSLSLAVCDILLSGVSREQIQRTLKQQFVPVVLQNPDEGQRTDTLRLVAEQVLGQSSYRSLLGVSPQGAVRAPVLGERGGTLPAGGAVGGSASPKREGASVSDGVISSGGALESELPAVRAEWTAVGMDEIRLVMLAYLASPEEWPQRLLAIPGAQALEDESERRETLLALQALARMSGRTSLELIFAMAKVVSMQGMSPYDWANSCTLGELMASGLGVPEAEILAFIGALIDEDAGRLEALSRLEWLRWWKELDANARPDLLRPDTVLARENAAFLRFLLRSARLLSESGRLGAGLEQALVRMELNALDHWMQDDAGTGAGGGKLRFLSQERARKVERLMALRDGGG